MNELSRPFVPGRNKSRFDEVPESTPAPKLTDRQALRLIVENADLLDGPEYSEGRWLLAEISREVVDYLAALDAELDGLEPDNDAEGNERGGTEDDEPDDEDTCIEDQVFDRRRMRSKAAIRDTTACEDYERVEHLKLTPDPEDAEYHRVISENRATDLRAAGVMARAMRNARTAKARSGG